MLRRIQCRLPKSQVRWLSEQVSETSIKRPEVEPKGKDLEKYAAELRALYPEKAEPVVQVVEEEVGRKGFWGYIAASALVSGCAVGVFAYRLGREEVGKAAGERVRKLRKRVEAVEAERDEWESRALVAEARVSALDTTPNEIPKAAKQASSGPSLTDWLMGKGD